MNAIKGIQGKDGPLLLDYSGVANVPGAVKSIADLKAKAGDHFEVDTVGPDGTIQTVRAVEKPAGGNGEGQNAGLTAEQINALDGMFRVAAYDDDSGYAAAYAAFQAAFELDSGGYEPGGGQNDTAAEFDQAGVVLGTTETPSAKAGYSVTRLYDLGYSLTDGTENVVYNLPTVGTEPSGQYSKFHAYHGNAYVTYYSVAGYNAESKTLIEGRWGETSQLRFAFATDLVDDAYAYMETSGKVLFAGKNTPYYGLSNISQVQG